MFEFSIHVRVNASRHITKRLAEVLAELLEEACCPDAYRRDDTLLRAMQRVRGMTVEVTGVTQITSKGGE